MSQVSFPVGEEFKSKGCISPVVLAGNCCQNRRASGFILTWAPEFHKGGHKTTGSVFREWNCGKSWEHENARSLESVSQLRRRWAVLLFEWSPGVYFETNMRVNIYCKLKMWVQCEPQEWAKCPSRANANPLPAWIAGAGCSVSGPADIPGSSETQHVPSSASPLPTLSKPWTSMVSKEWEYWKVRKDL